MKQNPLIECGCGCGNDIIIKPHHKYYGIPSYIQGHISKEQRKNKSEKLKRLCAEGKHPLLGKHFSEEWKRNLSLSHLGQKSWLKGLTKETDERVMLISKRMKERVVSKETKLKLKIANTGKVYSEDFCNKIKKLKIDYWKNNPQMKIKYKEMKGNKCSNWQGGKSFEPYTFDFNKQFKESIKERDHYSCQLCNIGLEDLHLLKRYLIIHHINYDKKLSIKENCISLCNKCHAITNHNRTHWTNFFQSLLKERYNYQFNEEQLVIVDLNKEVN